MLSLSFEANIEPKLAYLRKELALSEEALRESVIKSPALLGYSLDRRYKPRIELCRRAGAPAELVVTQAKLNDVKFKDLIAQWRRQQRTQ